jgi:hypothetical protein
VSTSFIEHSELHKLIPKAFSTRSIEVRKAVLQGIAFLIENYAGCHEVCFGKSSVDVVIVSPQFSLFADDCISRFISMAQNRAKHDSRSKRSRTLAVPGIVIENQGQDVASVSPRSS